ncbi:peptide-methionine (R)-S-oxide reductase [Sphingomonas ginkgonis]|uniref:peptide-methionine (R)-S-oxide reductase n=2 Tax=Sphingomonas ginkgonis TaxID=2315330 RepID=A0A3R9WUQ7_9SPHN|nr:peptide-methionine (R)-S-oxide reductase [Sphingomonas ginkgonis]
MRMSKRTFLGATGTALCGLVAGACARQSEAAPGMTFAVNHSDADWRRMLGPQRYPILRQAATERAFTSPLLNEHRAGTFTCAGCASPLFSSRTKFESGTGWPSFWQALPGRVLTRADHSLMMERTEVLCRRCGGHLGHVFDDGPRPTGKRFCMNGLALKFAPGAAA